MKDDRRKHVAVLGHRKSRHLQPGGLVQELINAARAVEQRKLGVTMKMNEVLIRHFYPFAVDRLSLAVSGKRKTVNGKRWRSLRNFTRYYNGVPFSRTPISCVAMAFFVCLVCAREARAAVTFPLEAKWSATLPALPAFPPAFDANRVYVSLNSKQLVALMLTDGTASWSVECPMSAAPAAGGGLVYAGSDGLIEARSDANGSAQWRRPVQGRVVSLHWDGGWLFAQTDGGPFLAIRSADGEILWQKDFGSPLTQRAPPAASGDRLYLPLQDGRVVALVLQSGGVVWTHKMAEPAVGILPVGNRVFIGGRDNWLYSLSAEDAKRDWRWPTGADLLGLPVLDRRRVYFIALDNILRGHDRNGGAMIWKQVLPFRPFTGPLLSGDTLVVAGIASQLYGYNSADGKLIDKFELKGAENEEILLAAPPHLTAQDRCIVVTRRGQERAFGTAPSPDAVPASAEPNSAAPAGTPPASPDAAPEPNSAPAGAATPGP
jgi:outer membrane protein assembly factor BamB